MEAKGIESKSPRARSPRRLGRLGMAVVGLTLAIGGSVLLVPALSSAHTDNTAASTAPLKPENDNLATVASKMNLGAGALLAAERSLEENALNSGGGPAFRTVSETQALIAIAQDHHFGVGELLGAERALQNASLGMSTTAAGAPKPSTPEIALAETRALVAAAERYHFGIGELLGAERCPTERRHGLRLTTSARVVSARRIVTPSRQGVTIRAALTRGGPQQFDRDADASHRTENAGSGRVSKGQRRQPRNAS